MLQDPTRFDAAIAQDLMAEEARGDLAAFIGEFAYPSAKPQANPPANPARTTAAPAATQPPAPAPSNASAAPLVPPRVGKRPAELAALAVALPSLGSTNAAIADSDIDASAPLTAEAPRMRAPVRADKPDAKKARVAPPMRPALRSRVHRWHSRTRDVYMHTLRALCANV